MKKIRTLCAALMILAATATGCANYGYTRQPIQNIDYLKEGMSKNEVLSIMGVPVKRDFAVNIEVWQYCRTGTWVDDFVALLFKNDILVGAKNYNVTYAQTGGISGDCSKFTRSPI